ncbi:MAG TPA: menaquinone biosynthesis protein [Tepidisphaeraceae bacterium]|nr:menaquinone biosynthesis protein [Tepidisphaeraceae bacterium]
MDSPLGPQSSVLSPAYRLGGVSFLNSKPLLHALDSDPKIRLALDVPSRLIDGLRSETFDAALLPVIDYQRMDDLRIVPSGGIGSDGATLTVRIFSPVPIEKISTLAFDPDSHTSVALARIILAERYGLRPRAGDGGARLLIGDKVVLSEPRDMPHQLDLGQAWKELTGMPFVFAVWTARAGIELGDLPQRLEAAKRRGLRQIDSIIERFALPTGWPAELARQYLTRNLQFDIGPSQLRAMERFYELAAAHDIIAHPPRPLRF